MANYERYHGLVLREFAKLPEGAHLKAHDAHGIVNCFIVNSRVGVLIKHSSKRISPWTFGFTQDNLTELQLLSEVTTKTFICLVCGYDGFTTLSEEELKLISDKKQADGTLSVHIRRRKRHMYSVGGRDKLERSKSRGLNDEILQEISN